MKCFDCKKESAGFQFGENGIFLCFYCMAKRADKLSSDPKFVEASRKAFAENCCCDDKDVKDMKDGEAE